MPNSLIRGETMIWSYLIFFLLFLYFLFFSFWLISIKKSVDNNIISKKKLFIIYFCIFLFFTYFLSFIILKIPY